MVGAKNGWASFTNSIMLEKEWLASPRGWRHILIYGWRLGWRLGGLASYTNTHGKTQTKVFFQFLQ